MSVGLAGALLLLQLAGGGWEEAPALPRALTNNAVAALERPDGSATVFSFMGIEDTGRGVPVSRAFRWDVGSPAWEEIPAVPGPARLGATAQAIGGRVYLFGGRTEGAEGRPLGSVDIYDPESRRWSRGAPMPVPVSDAVSGVWRDSLVYVVSGRAGSGPVRDVQLYDPRTDRWSAATPVSGAPVLGHAGGVARDAIVYLDGARAADESGGSMRFAMEASAWRGDIDPADPSRVRWTRLPAHPGAAAFGGAAGVVGTRVIFMGGSDQPHDRSGIAAGGRPASPLALGVSYDVAAGAWRQLRVPSTPTMDQRALVRAGGYLLLIGGMEPGARATARVRRVSVVTLLATGG